jgi:hypothetical protein
VRHVLTSAVLVVSLVVPGAVLAESTSSLPYTLSSPPTMLSTRTFTATFGGVAGTITTTSSGSWKMTVGGQTFASGTYTCSGGTCTFTGATLLGKAVTFTMTSTTGTVSGLFATHGAWVSAVAQWAKAHLSGQQIGDIVSAAARIEGMLASGDQNRRGRDGRSRP